MRAIVAPEAGSYSYAGTGYANPHAVTQIANGQSTTTYSYDKSRGRMHYATGTRLRIASPVLRSPRLTLKVGRNGRYNVGWRV